MMTMQVTGIDDVKRILDDVAPKRALNLMTATIRGVAADISKEIKLNAPKDSGNLIKSIKIKKARSEKGKPVFRIVFDSGKGKKNDGFYWRFLEHGTKSGLKASNFVRESRLKIESNLDFYISANFTKKLESAIKKELKRQAVSQ